MSALLPALLSVQVLFPSADVTPTPFDGATVRIEDGAAVTEVVPDRKFCGVKFILPKPMAFNRCTEYGVEVSNRTDRALGFILHAIHDGQSMRYATCRFRLAPFEGRTVTAPNCPPNYRMEPGTDGLEGLNGYDRRHQPGRVNRSSEIHSFIVTCNRQEAPAEYDVKRLWVEGDRDDRTIRVDGMFFPFVDEFGQYAHADWPGKVHSLAELEAAAKRAETDLAACPDSPIPGVDRFGGWGAGPQLEATGMFRTEKWNGRWWLVDPDGHIFFSLGCNYVRIQGLTPVTGRERMFSWLPVKEDLLFADCWAKAGSTWQNLSFYKDKGAVFQFDFARANQKRLYGSEWRAKSLDRQHRRMRAWGFTSMGNWSDPEIMSASRTPYVDNFNLDSVRKIQGDTKGAWRKFPDVYSPDFEEQVFKCAFKTRTAKSRTDPWCIGWFVENELRWATDECGGYLTKAVVDSPADQPARIELLRRLRAAHGPDADFDSVTKENVRVFEADVAERYFSTVRRAIEKVAPGRLYLGCRFASGCPEAYRAASRHCDVVSFNSYTDLPEYVWPETGMVDKPVMIGEFHFGSLDRGGLHAGLRPCWDMADRVAHYKRYVRHAIRDERLVGVHWFFWFDMPVSGWMDGENFANGVMDVADNPHPEMVEATRELAREFYRQ